MAVPRPGESLPVCADGFRASCVSGSDTPTSRQLMFQVSFMDALRPGASRFSVDSR